MTTLTRAVAGAVIVMLAVGMFARGEAVGGELALPVYLRDRVVDAAAVPP